MAAEPAPDEDAKPAPFFVGVLSVQVKSAQVFFKIVAASHRPSTANPLMAPLPTLVSRTQGLKDKDTMGSSDPCELIFTARAPRDRGTPRAAC